MESFVKESWDIGETGDVETLLELTSESQCFFVFFFALCISNFIFKIQTPSKRMHLLQLPARGENCHSNYGGLWNFRKYGIQFKFFYMHFIYTFTQDTFLYEFMRYLQLVQ